MSLHTPNERRYTINDLLLRIDIRNRALLYAEYHHYSAALIRNNSRYVVQQRDWKHDVRRIELHLIREEAPDLIFINLRDFQIRRTFFQQPNLNEE